MSKCAENGQVSGANIEPFLLGKYSAEMLECYGPYMRSFEKKTEELLQLRKNEKFSNFLLNQLGNSQCQGQPIDALLIRPIQRIPSLLLLYKGLISRFAIINCILIGMKDHILTFYIQTFSKHCKRPILLMRKIYSSLYRNWTQYWINSIMKRFFKWLFYSISITTFQTHFIQYCPKLNSSNLKIWVVNEIIS